MSFGRTGIVVLVVAGIQVLTRLSAPDLDSVVELPSGPGVQVGPINLRAGAMGKSEPVQVARLPSFQSAGALLHWSDSKIESAVGPVRFVSFSPTKESPSIDETDAACDLVRQALASPAGLEDAFLSTFASATSFTVCNFRAAGNEGVVEEEVERIHPFVVIPMLSRCRAHAVGVVDLPLFLALNPSGRVLLPGSSLMLAEYPSDAIEVLGLRALDWGPATIVEDEECRSVIEATHTALATSSWVLFAVCVILSFVVRRRSKLAPLIPADRTSTDTRPATPTSPALDTVIIVERDQAVRERLSAWFSERGFSPLAFAELAPATAAAAEGAARCVLLRVETSQAAEAVNAVCSGAPQARVVVVLDQANIGATTGALRAGASDVFDRNEIDMERVLLALELKSLPTHA